MSNFNFLYIPLPLILMALSIFYIIAQRQLKEEAEKNMGGDRQ